VFAVVPAHNEAPSVGDVVRALHASGVLHGVVVVDDGSADDTAVRAQQAGAHVLRLERNVGKGEAMLTGVSEIELLGDHDDRVMFVDADLVGLQPWHVQRLVALSHGYDQAGAILDRGFFRGAIATICPLITGQRVVKKAVLDQLPHTCWRGYAIEVALNDAVQRRGGSTACMLWPDVTQRTKLGKVGWVRGMLGHWRMGKQIAKTKRALKQSGGASCAT
jgi:glycosyltransferase involved in cell wall biosynthesis